MSGGSAIILKYSGRNPARLQQTTSRPSTPVFPGFPLKQRTLGARSPLSAHAKFLQNPGAVEALFQGAAKGVMERGEKLGINQAVRDAMGEIRRNMQGLHDARGSPKPYRDPLVAGGVDRPASVAVAAYERRNRRLAAVLDDAVAGLKLATADTQGAGEDGNENSDSPVKPVEAIELAMAKIELVKLHLQDSSLALPDEEDLPPISNLSLSPARRESRSPTVALDTTPVVATSSAVESTRSAVLSSPSSLAANQLDGPSSPPPPPATARAIDPLGIAPTPSPSTLPPPILPSRTEDLRQPAPSSQLNPDCMDTDPTDINPSTKVEPPLPSTNGKNPDANNGGNASAPNQGAAIAAASCSIPARSTLAQSSFSWMLEPDDVATTTRSASATPPPHRSRPPSSNSGVGGLNSGVLAANAAAGGRRPPNSRSNSSRERNAFLFGEVTSDAGGAGRLGADDIFGLMPLRGGRGKGGKKGSRLESLEL